MCMKFSFLDFGWISINIAHSYLQTPNFDPPNSKPSNQSSWRTSISPWLQTTDYFFPNQRFTLTKAQSLRSAGAFARLGSGKSKSQVTYNYMKATIPRVNFWIVRWCPNRIRLRTLRHSSTLRTFISTNYRKLKKSYLTSPVTTHILRPDFVQVDLARISASSAPRCMLLATNHYFNYCMTCAGIAHPRIRQLLLSSLHDS